jgi:Uncharacterized protein involved in biosynthesis of c-type cytochromes
VTSQAPPARRSMSVNALLVSLAIAVAALTLSAVALAGQPPARTAAAQAHQIASGLRCPVCKDLSAADSPAPLAGQMRQQIADQVAQGRSPEQIRSHFIAAYGDSVLMTPPRRGLAGTAYHLPLIVMAVGLLISFMLLRRWLRKPESDLPADDSSPLSASQRRALDRAVARLREEEPR